MTSRIIVVDPFDFIVFGGTGDLAYRKLLPALYHRHRDGQIPAEGRIIGVSRRERTDEEYRESARKAFDEYLKDDERDPETLEAFLKRLHFVSVDARGSEGWDQLKALLDEASGRIRAFYLAVGP